ncbi:MAG TPA: diacylglycerol kinase family protein [Bacillota bacterium]|nr:diacylglycerol kinase family protein [Bacillota bacterium]
MFLIIHNPLSNNKKSKKTTNKMVRFFKRHSIPFVLRSTLKIENLNDFLDKNTQITDILYLGGDGSINYLINHVDVSKIHQNLYLAKSGSGNDFLRSLSKIQQGQITVGEAKTNQGIYRFINGAGIGIDSLICHYVDSDSKKNKLSYFINFFRAIIKYRRMDFTVTVDGVEHVYHKGYFVAVQNGKFFGGGMKVAPQANITNDDFVVCVAHNLNNLVVQLLFMTIYFGWHKMIKKRIAFLKGKEISIKINDPYYFQTDGELVSDVNEIHITKAFSKEFHAFEKNKFKTKVFKKDL